MTSSFQVVRNLIQSSQYSDAVQAYYKALGNEYYCEHTKELLYLKRLAFSPVQGRDLLFFLSPSSRADIINDNLVEYVDLIDEVLLDFQAEKIRKPLDILVDCVPTMDTLIQTRNYKYKHGVNIIGGTYEKEDYVVGEGDFTLMWDKCISGVLFDKFPDPVVYCRALEWQYPDRYFGLWIIHSPQELQKNVYSNGLHINWIDVYSHKSWKIGSSKRKPDFTEAKSLNELRKEIMPTSVITCNEPGDIRFTGKTHRIGKVEFFEIDVLWKSDFQTAKVVSNPLLEQIEEILREAENRLRERKGLPRIGEGWVMETFLYKLVCEFFPDALQHASPPWLKPQHLDIYIPSIKLAIEYHGLQHFEPVEFFGGKEALAKNQQRDKRKMALCQKNDVQLFVWRYDEPVTKERLTSMFNKLGISFAG